MKRDNSASIAEAIFGSGGQYFLKTTEIVVTNATSPAFEWPKDVFEIIHEERPLHGNWIFWVEFLGRIYMGSVLSVARQRCWLRGVLAAYESENLLSFAANLRSLIESAADSYYSLLDAAYMVGDNFHTLNKKFSEPEWPLAFGGSRVTEIEDRLIHFIFAEKKSKTEVSSPSHQSKHTAFYIDQLETFAPDLKTFYSELCAYVHPSASSLQWAFKLSEDRNMNAWRYEMAYSDSQSEQIDALIEGKRVALEHLLYAAINPSLLALKVISKFDNPPFDLAFMNSIDLSRIPAWRKMSQAFTGVKSLH